MKKRSSKSLLLLILLCFLLVACGGKEASGSGVGDAERGKLLYEQPVIGSSAAPGCVTCHSREAGRLLVGPSHANLAVTAETVVPGKSAEDYLRESIIEPDAHITEGFTAGIMYQNYGKDLSEQEINDLVAYLLTLK